MIRSPTMTIISRPVIAGAASGGPKPPCEPPYPVIRNESATLENKIGKPAQELFHRFVNCRVLRHEVHPDRFGKETETFMHARLPLVAVLRFCC
jgi:hypothetical protein